ncbi:FAD-dependent oxidoreductase [Streptomyces sp. DSM 110735]|uniref:FAD-dependent monooxygenase n=1 Tax=Streptomyces sp. DSM 110735 TaxID=2775031 RepID=UPI0018F57E25|nr:FAD-dependent monooxygenase [Streptomyces sp. DSM 110735]MBJ7903017.1 FAD-dependent oxidoreductase [Streptomyces sp. DSM 110735]
METSVDVTVVGAGPVGLVLAAELALAGVTVQVIERREQPDQALKAQSINVPTAEALDRRGLLPAARRIQREVLDRMGSYAGVAGEQRPEARFTGHFAGIVLDPDLVDWSDPDLAAHTAADARMVPQRELEALLTEHVTRLGVPVRRGVEVTGLDDTGDGVLVGTNAGVLHTGWLVGCDGGHSTVRRLAGIEFPGTDPELTGYQAVVDIADPEKLASGWTWSARGAYRYGPQPGRVATVEFDAPPADRSTPVTLEDVQSSLRRISGTDVTLTALRATPTRWTDNTRQAAAYCSGRVLLAGDAAHVHPPFGGQGLNLGVGDAMNLGWKLGAVIAGRAPAGLLDTYDTERRPLGAWVLDWTRAQIGILRGDPKSAALRSVVTDLLGTRDGTTYAVKQISGVTQRTALPGAHPLTGRYSPDLHLSDGSRLTDHAHNGGFLLLDRSPDGAFAGVAAGWADRVRRVTDADTTPAPTPTPTPIGVLVRPDGVIAWASDTANTAELTSLEAALLQWAGKPGTPCAP